MSKPRVVFAVALLVSSILACSSTPTTAPEVRKVRPVNQAQRDDVPDDTTCRSGYTNPNGRC